MALTVSNGKDRFTKGKFAVPSVLEKLPQPLRLTITRGKDYEEWKMSDLLENLGGEIELWEQYSDSRRFPKKEHFVKNNFVRRKGKELCLLPWIVQARGLSKD